MTEWLSGTSWRAARRAHRQGQREPIYVVQGHIESWISNGSVPYTDPSGSGDTITLKQFRRC